ncbi:MAG: bifunctional nuclease domain-containing protein, partial [Planctomycetota bacterium]
MTSTQLLDVRLARIVMRDSSDRQYIYLEELGVETPRGFPIVIGTQEADEIYRVVHQIEPQRPLTHMLAFKAIGALDAKVVGVDIVALQHNTFFARIELER